MRSKAGFSIHQNPSLTSNPEPLQSPSEHAVARSVPSTLDPWLDTNAMPRYRKEARDGNRAVAYGLIALAIAFYVGISWGMGWGPFR